MTGSAPFVEPGAPGHYLVLLEVAAVAFCHYENPFADDPGAPSWIDARLLGAIVRHAETTGAALTFVHGRHRPPARLRRAMDHIPHAAIAPLALRDAADGAIVVLDSEDRPAFADLEEDWGRNLILRVERADLGRWSDLLASLVGRFGRLSIHLRGIEYFAADDIALHARDLERAADIVGRLHAEGRPVEVNFLTDRMALGAMRNCDAGVAHVTIAADGACFACPGDIAAEVAPIGRFDPKAGPILASRSLLTLARAPLCVRCDAYHCKRCIHLSRGLTGEPNTPSQQQCQLAHAEREASRRLLNRLDGLEHFRRLPRIPELNHRDPLEVAGGPAPAWLFDLATAEGR